jgi:hypothetical protein
MIKEHKNIMLPKDDTGLPGPNIDGIIGITKLNLDFMLVEVYLPCIAAENQSYYKDRSKISE